MWLFGNWWAEEEPSATDQCFFTFPSPWLCITFLSHIPYYFSNVCIYNDHSQSISYLFVFQVFAYHSNSAKEMFFLCLEQWPIKFPDRYLIKIVNIKWNTSPSTTWNLLLISLNYFISQQISINFVLKQYNIYVPTILEHRVVWFLRESEFHDLRTQLSFPWVFLSPFLWLFVDHISSPYNVSSRAGSEPQ